MSNDVFFPIFNRIGFKSVSLKELFYNPVLNIKSSRKKISSKRGK